MAELASPNVGNYAILKGKVFFTPESGTRRSLGNCTQFDVEPTVDTLDHFSSQEGVKSKDYSATIQVSAIVSLTLDEISLKNLQLALFGGAIAADSAATDTTERADTGFDVLAVTSVTGKLEIEGTNDVGPRYNGRFESVTFKPNGAVSFIGDADWATIQLQGDILKTDGKFGRIDLVAERDGQPKEWIMVSLLDIAPAAAKMVTVNVGGQEVEVRGISLADIAYLIQSFPEVRDMFNGKDVEFTVDSLLERAPSLIYDVIACGTGLRGNAAAVGVASNLGIEDQTALLEAILKETFKGGVGPFVERTTRLLRLGSDAGTKALASKSPKPPKH